MGIKVTKSSTTLHPEGWYPFCIKDAALATGKFGTQVKWIMESKEIDEEGNRITLIYFTGLVISTHPECKLTRLVECCGEEPDEFGDTDQLLGKVFAGKVEWDEGEKYSNIVQIRPRDYLKKKQQDAAEGRRSKAKDAPAKVPNDPFEEE